MPSKSRAQANLMRAAAHGATFAKAREVRASMTPEQLRDFATMKSDAPKHAPYSETHRYDWRSRANLKRGRTT